MKRNASKGKIAQQKRRTARRTSIYFFKSLAIATDVLHVDEPIRVRKRGPSYVLSMRLPFAERDELDVYRKGDELYIKVGPYKRNIILPQTLQRLTVQEARFEADRLEVRFAREPSQASAGAGMEGRR